MSKVIEKLLLESGLAITNTQSVGEIRSLMAGFGYTDKRMANSKVLHDEAETLYQAQVKEYGEKDEASLELQVAQAKANAPYMKYVGIARVAMSDNVAGWQSLKLGGRRKATYSGWVSDARLFYINLMGSKSLLDIMAGFGITSEKLKEGLALVEVVEQKLAKYREELGQAQNATQERDKKVDALQAWYSDFKEIARIALEDKPQYLEMLGIVEPS